MPRVILVIEKKCFWKKVKMLARWINLDVCHLIKSNYICWFFEFHLRLEFVFLFFFLALRWFFLILQSTVSRPRETSRTKKHKKKLKTQSSFARNAINVGVNYGSRNFRFWFFIRFSRIELEWSSPKIKEKKSENRKFHCSRQTK